MEIEELIPHIEKLDSFLLDNGFVCTQRRENNNIYFSYTKDNHFLYRITKYKICISKCTSFLDDTSVYNITNFMEMNKDRKFRWLFRNSKLKLLL